jgi:hypothetical protein
MLLSTYLSLTFIENFHAFSSSHVFKTLFQLLHFSIFLCTKNHFKHKFSYFENFMQTLGFFTKKNKTQKQTNFTIDFGDFFLNPFILVCIFVAPNYAFCP